MHIHNKYLSCDIKGNDIEFLRSQIRKPTYSTTKNNTHTKKLALSQLIPKIKSPLKETQNFNQSNKIESYKFRNKKLEMEKQLKLPQVGYLVTNLRAPYVGSIQAVIKEKLLISKLEKAPTQEEMDKIFKEQRELRRRKSLESFISELSEDTDEKLEQIMQADPKHSLQGRRDVTIHQKVSRQILEERGIKSRDDFEDDTIRKQVDIADLRIELQSIQNTQPTYSSDILDVMHRQVEKKKLRENKVYKKIKDPKTQLLQKKILNVKDCTIFSKLYLLNNNPLMQINEMISLPYILNDSNLLANIYHVNLYKLKNLKDKNVNFK
jgi:hypothetical protein